MPLIPLLLIRSCAILRADWGAVLELVPNVLTFELAAATVVVELAIRGAIGKKVDIRLNLFSDQILQVSQPY